MRDYEALVILKPILTEEQVASFVARAKKKIESKNGEFVKVENMGNRKLPFRVNKHKSEKDGLFILIKFKGEGDIVFALRDDFRIQEDILRHLISHVSEDQKVLIEELEVEHVAEVKEAN
ncbi:30S ribosomal protein S6 [candidate division WOR-1 bacterium RIFOXYD2_FULL_36_8]|nr:MAG: 30S ribosomal protein S6 [candidate division WOR-1 bacterium RIFOXYD2_FULL_36_8]